MLVGTKPQAELQVLLVHFRLLTFLFVQTFIRPARSNDIIFWLPVNYVCP